MQSAVTEREGDQSRDKSNAGWNRNHGSAAMIITSSRCIRIPCHVAQFPENNEETMQSKFAQEWKEAMESELRSIRDHRVVDDIVDKGSTPGTTIIIGITCSYYTVKPHKQLLKARAAVQGSREKLRDKASNVFSP